MASPEAAPSAEAPPATEASGKVTIKFLAVGNAPMMRKTKFSIDGTSAFAALEVFLRDQLKLRREDRLFLYCDSAFSPSPTEPLRDLLACFGSRGELLVSYSMTGAYG